MERRSLLTAVLTAIPAFFLPKGTKAEPIVITPGSTTFGPPREPVYQVFLWWWYTPVRNDWGTAQCAGPFSSLREAHEMLYRIPEIDPGSTHYWFTVTIL